MKRSNSPLRGTSISRDKLLGGLLLALAAFTGASAPASAAENREPGLIFGPGPAGWWDSERVSCPKVLHDEERGWRMWYYGRDRDFDRSISLPTGRVGMARSEDGIQWQRVEGPLTMGAVLEPHPQPERFDSAHVGISDIQRHGEHGALYTMWYFGGRQVAGGGGPRGFPLRPGMALSRDGLHWTRLEGPFDGAMLDVGGRDEFDAIMVAWPQMVRADDGSWYLYYHTLTQEGHYVVGLATSTDGLQWRKVGPIMGPGPKGRFDDLGVATRHVIRHEGRWLMFYEGVQDIGEAPAVGRQLGLAVSADGIEWQRLDGDDTGGAIVAQSPIGSERWDHRLGCPWAVPMDDGSIRLYYIGSNERPPGQGHAELLSVHQIGLAISDGDLTRWRRWQGDAAP
jgi:hypothetical protein